MARSIPALPAPGASVAALAAGPSPSHGVPGTAERREAFRARMVGPRDGRSGVEGWRGGSRGRPDPAAYGTWVAPP